jgi:phosphoadenosine phosphosulfate reductase
LARLACESASALETASPVDVLRWASFVAGDRFCVLSSMQDLTLVHLASQAVPGVQVAFVDTDYHFPETLEFARHAASTMQIRLVTLRANVTVAEQAQHWGPDLFAREPHQCCALRKVQPFDEACAHLEIWATGARRGDADTRRRMPRVAWDERRNVIQIAPIVDWTEGQAREYARDNGLPIHALKDRGYESIGCWPCTAPVEPGQHPRSGRWPGTDKVECGLNLLSAEQPDAG